MRIIGIAGRERDPEAPSRITQEKGYTYGPRRGGGSVAQQFQVPGYPTLFVIDGAVASSSHVGMSDALHDDIAAVLDRALAAD